MSESKMKPRLRAEELTGMISLLNKFVRSENLRRCCFVPTRIQFLMDLGAIHKVCHAPEGEGSEKV